MAAPVEKLVKEAAEKGPKAPETVYQKIARVMVKLSTVGIKKDQTNTFDHYKFRGIDDVYNALAPAISEAGLVILPEVVEREVVERETQKGGALFYVTLKVKYHFVSADDGSTHVVTAYGEAMDRGDKATNKAMSAAYKYACFQTFCIPTEAQDADAETHEVKAGVMAAVKPGLKFNEGQRDRIVNDIDQCFTGTGKTLECVDGEGLHALIDELKGDNDLKVAVWSALPSGVRSFIKDMERV